jgi:WD40 repeat protein
VKKIAILTATIAAAFSAQGADKVTYDDHVLPIFRNACLNCHNPDKKKAGLDLSTYQATIQGSENGKVLQSGNAASSLLFKCVKGTEEPKMPPKGDKLSDAELAVVEKWIAGQLLENATGKAIAVANNNVAVAVVSLERPAGPPPMPGDLPLEPYVRTKTTNALTALAVSPWAPLVAVGGQKQVLLYNTETLAPLGVLPFPEGFPSIIKFSRNGQLLLTGGGLGGKSGKVALWDIKTGERIATLGNEFDQVLAADLSADQQFVALGGPTKLLKIYSTKDGKLVHSIKKHTDWITAIAFSPDGKYLASADRSGGVQVWEGATGKEFNALPGHKAMVTGLAFMPGVLASSSEDGKISLWDAKEGKEIRSWAAHPGGTAWVDFTPDGRLVSCGRDKIAKVWDQNGKQLGKTEPMSDIALRTALSNDRVIVGDWTGEIRVTNLEGKVLGALTSNPPALADRVSATAKILTESQASLPVLQQQFAAAETKLKAEQAAAEANYKTALAAAETKRNEAQKAVEALKAAIPQTEKRVADLKEKMPALQQARDAAKMAAEAAQKAAADKQATNAPANEVEPLQREATAKAGARDEAQKQVEALKAQIAQAEAELGKMRGEQPAKIAAADKALQLAATQLIEAQKPAPVAAAVTAADQELAKIKTALEQSTADLAAAKLDAERWKIAQVLQAAYNARRSLADKQAQHEQFVLTAKNAPQAVESAKSDLAAAEKTVAEGPAKTKEKEAAFAQSRVAVEEAKKVLAVAEAALPEKDKAAKAAAEAAPPVGDVAGITKKLEEQNAEIVKLKEARAAFAAETPEYKAANEKYQGFKAEIAKTQAALTAASAKNLEAPEVKAARDEFAKAQETLDAAKLALKAAVQTAAGAEKALAQIKKDVEAATQLAARLQKEMPTIVKNAETQKVQAEQAATAAAKEVEAAKIEAEKRRAEYDTLKNGGTKAASLAVPPSKS